jgi:O-antigen chain-terminating methyltransferase
LAQDQKFNGVVRIDIVDLDRIRELLNEADLYSEVPSKLSDKFNHFPLNLSLFLQKFLLKLYGFLFKKQRVVNFSLSSAIRESLAVNLQLVEQAKVLQEQINAMSNRLTAVDERIQGCIARLNTTDNRLHGASERLTNAEIHLIAMSDHLGITDGQVHEVSERLMATNERLIATNERLTVTSEYLTATSDHLTATSDRLTATSDRLTATSDRLTATSDRLTATSDRLTDMDERHLRNDTYLKIDLAQQKRLIALFLEEARQRLPEPFTQEQLQTFVQEDQHLLEAFYVAFEDHFRGSREDILNRLKVYLPLLEEAKVGTLDAPILDVGCGRGEWLELLSQSGYTARGIDLNRVMVEQCKARNLDVSESDVIAYLQSLPDTSFGAVTGFHIIEHLPFETLVRLLDETVRVLKPGGLAIFETPNPENVLVGSCNFYFDPTHCNPLPSPMIKFLVEARGLCKAKIINLHPYPETFKVNGSELAERFNEYFYGSQDYAIVGYKL